MPGGGMVGWAKTFIVGMDEQTKETYMGTEQCTLYIIQDWVAKNWGGI